MPSLMDVGAMTATVTVRGKPVTTYPVTAAGLFFLMRNSEEIRLLMDGRAADIKPEQLMKMGPDNIALVIGVGTVDPDTTPEDAWEAAVQETKKIARRVNAADQLRLIVSIYELTFPDGVGPFVEALNALAKGLDGGAQGDESASQSSSSDGGSAQLVTDINQLPPGVIRRAS